MIDVRGATVRYPTFKMEPASIKSAFLSPFTRGMRPTFVEALQGIDLTIRGGDRVALIGRNGAGKSTLLRAIAGVYPLSSGTISIASEPCSLFDLGIGFHMEESGRNNIYYRGYLLGLSRSEITRREAAIIAFAELSEAIDRPLKTYSAGMQVRLAFSISTIMPSEILLIDEVLAAGDADFAVKARARIEELVDASASLVLVTHDMSAVRALCNKAVWMDGGRVMAQGAPDDVIGLYMDASVDQTGHDDASPRS